MIRLDKVLQWRAVEQQMQNCEPDLSEQWRLLVHVVRSGSCLTMATAYATAAGSSVVYCNRCCIFIHVKTIQYSCASSDLI
nr:hypothetical protein CFP56_16358 [Quercus suber]